MNDPEREKIVESLSYESRIGFIAFCVERCLNEARRHTKARGQLEKLPLITEGVEMLWARAERGVVADPERIKTISAHLETYEVEAPDFEGVVYNYDVALVDTARVLNTGMRALENPDLVNRASLVVAASDGAIRSVGGIYADWEEARDAELAIADTALQRLQEWGEKPFSRAALKTFPSGQGVSYQSYMLKVI